MNSDRAWTTLLEVRPDSICLCPGCEKVLEVGERVLLMSTAPRLRGEIAMFCSDCGDARKVAFTQGEDDAR